MTLLALLELAAFALVGRVALSLLPPGWPGGHGPRELAATWAASHLLGLALLALQRTALGLAALLTGWQPADAVLSAWLLGPWALLGLLRLATLPGAMRPRHEPRHEPGSRAGRAAGLAGTGLLVAAGVRLGLASGLPAAAASLVAAAVVAVQALGQARRAPWIRAAALLAAGLALLLLRSPLGIDERYGQPLFAPLLAGAAAAATVWLRRADRRAAALSLLCLAAVPLGGVPGSLAALLGLAALVASTPAPARLRLARLGLPAVIVGILLAGASGPMDRPAGPPSAGDLAALLALGLALPALAVQRARSAAPPGRAETSARAAVAAGAFLAAGALGTLLARLPGAGAWLALAPLAVLTAGLAAPGERPA